MQYGGYGQLTQKGMQRAFDFGTQLRKKYNDFLSKSYSRNEVFVMSTDYDRTLMTVSSLLAGLFPPEDYQQWGNDSLGMVWQPIPIHTNDVKNDNVNSL